MKKTLILGNNYDRTLAVKCINGTFVGSKEENILSYKGIPCEGAVEDWDPDSKLFGHSWFIEGAIKMSECQTMGGGKSYTYQYRVESSDPILKCAHFEEVPVLFAHPEFVVGRTCSDLFCQTMRALWVQFAKTGNPSLTADQSPDGKAHNWPLYDLKDKRLMLLDDNDIRPAKEAEVHIVDWERTTFLTKYYML